MTEVRLLFGATIPGQRLLSTDLLWKTKFQAVDPFFLCEVPEGKPIMLVHKMEYGRARKEARDCRVEMVNPFMDRVNSKSQIDGLIEFLKQYTVDKIVVPNSMPYLVVKKLSDAGLSVVLQEEQELWYPERATKSAEEIKHISQVQGKAEEILSKVIAILQKSSVAADGTLISENGETITSESIREFIEVEFAHKGCLASNIIVACGDQAADPHSEGTGPLWAGLPTIIDIFARSKENWYWADITRTVFKHQPTEAIKKMYHAVLEAQCLAINMIQAGVDGAGIQKAVTEFFDKEGYKTSIKNEVPQGFIHAVGHGLGLDIHERPSISERSEVLPKGAVVTVEPGLYYLGIGGIRIEDLVVIKKGSARNLTSFPKELKFMIIP